MANPYVSPAGVGRARGKKGSERFAARLASPTSIFAPSGATHRPGFVPDPGGTLGTARFLREDATWSALASGTDPLTYAATISINTTNGIEMKTVTTTNAIGNSTFNAATAGVGGQKLCFVITNDATAPRTITFNTNFDANGTIVGVASKISTILFWSDGVAWREIARVVGVL